MALAAVEAVRRLRGGSQSQLMLCSDQRLWVVKFQNNPQGVRTLANEFIATRLAEAVGLPVPRTEIVVVSELVVACSPNLQIELPRGRRERFVSGEQFGSAFVGGLMPGLVVDYLLEDQMHEVRNLGDFAGILAFDKWTCNNDGRQAVYQRTQRETKFRAIFIDQGFCFGAGEWAFHDSPLRGIYAKNIVYARVMGWSSFEPWLSRIETLDAQTIWRIAEGVPSLWYGGSLSLLEPLVERLIARRSHVRDLIAAFRDSERVPFPAWRYPG